MALNDCQNEAELITIYMIRDSNLFYANRSRSLTRQKILPFVIREKNCLKKNIDNFVDLEAFRFSVIKEGVAKNLNDIALIAWKTEIGRKNVNKL